MDDELTAVVVELQCTVAGKDVRPNPVSVFEGFLATQKRPFAVEEYIIKKESVSEDRDWVEWFASHPSETEAFAAVLLVRPEDKVYFDGLWSQWLQQKEEANQSSQPTTGS